MNIINIENLTKVIKGTTILKNINLEISKGTVTGFIGRNGSGKSMLFKSICGFLVPTSGKINVFGKTIGKDISFPEKTGFLIEKPGFLPNFNGFKNLQFLAEIQNLISKSEIEKVITEVGLDPHSKLHYRKYSLGMKQRLGIAQAIMENPDLIILDEPTNGLDKNGVSFLHGLINDLKRMGKTILLASHNTLDIEKLCDKVYEMDNGNLVETNEVSGEY